MDSYLNDPQLPMGFGMALAQNLPAMEYFSALPRDRQQQIIQQTHAVRSKADMRAFVAGLTRS